MEVSLQLTREESPLFPRFHLPVLSPLEAAAKLLAPEGAESTLPAFSALLAFLAHTEGAERKREVCPDADNVLCGLLGSSSIPDWRLGPLFSGELV